MQILYVTKKHFTTLVITGGLIQQARLYARDMDVIGGDWRCMPRIQVTLYSSDYL